MWKQKHVEDPVHDETVDDRANGCGVSTDAIDRVIAALAPAERLSDSDLSLFSPAFEESQAAEQRCQEAQAAAQEAQVKAIEARGALHYLFRRFQIAYSLGPEDQLDSAGQILRKAPTP